MARWLGEGLTSLQVAVLFVASGATTRESLQPNRGWSDGAWAAAQASLTATGLLDPSGPVTPAGRAVRDRVEAATDRLAEQPFAGLAAEDRHRLLDALAPVAAAVACAGVIPYPNPMGVPPPGSTPAG